MLEKLLQEHVVDMPPYFFRTLLRRCMDNARCHYPILPKKFVGFLLSYLLLHSCDPQNFSFCLYLYNSICILIILEIFHKVLLCWIFIVCLSCWESYFQKVKLSNCTGKFKFHEAPSHHGYDHQYCILESINSIKTIAGPFHLCGKWCDR